MRRFVVVTPTKDDGIELHPMKEWLRQHPDQVPTGLDATMSTSHQLRLGLKKAGWSDQETDTEIRMVRPEDGDSQAIKIFVVDPPTETPEEEEDSAGQAAFGLEHQLRDFIAQNIESIPVNGRRLRLYVDATGRDGVEYPTAVGPIDILAIEKETEAFVVFELKRGRTPDHVIGQIARYMGWLKSTLAKDRDLSGVIVAKQIAPNLRYAVKAVPNVSLFEYEVSFTLKAAPDV